MSFSLRPRFADQMLRNKLADGRSEPSMVASAISHAWPPLTVTHFAERLKDTFGLSRR
jgi:hypothetical protein